MMRLHSAGAALASTLLLAGCFTVNPGVGPNGELPVIARPLDQGYDSISLAQSTEPAVAYDPDGCQVWILDDGIEGYAGRRRDRSSGLPVCNNYYPPGTVVNEYRTNDILDFVPSNPYGPVTGQAE